MSDYVLTPEHKKVCDDLHAGMVKWMDEEAAKSPEQRVEEFHAWQRREIAAMNEWPLDKRLEFLASYYDCDLEAIRAAVANVTFEWKVSKAHDVAAYVILNIQFKRPIEMVHVNFTIGDKDATD